MPKPDMDVWAFLPPLEPGVGLGAKHVLGAGYASEQAQPPIEADLASCDAAAFGLAAGSEFMPWAAVLEPPYRSAAAPPPSAIARRDLSGTGATVHPDAPGNRGERRFAGRPRPLRRPRPVR